MMVREPARVLLAVVQEPEPVVVLASGSVPVAVVPLRALQFVRPPTYKICIYMKYIYCPTAFATCIVSKTFDMKKCRK